MLPKTLSNTFNKCISSVKSLYFSPGNIFLLIGEENGFIRWFDLCDNVQRFLVYTKNSAMKIDLYIEFIYVEDNRNELEVYDINIAKKLKI